MVHLPRSGGLFFGKRLMPIRPAGREASVDAHIAALRPSEPFEPLPKSREARLHVGIVFGEGRQHADAPHPLRLLPARRERHAAAAPINPVMNWRRLTGR
jgi:hypothetical protein